MDYHNWLIHNLYTVIVMVLRWNVLFCVISDASFASLMNNTLRWVVYFTVLYGYILEVCPVNSSVMPSGLNCLIFYHK